MKATKAPTLTAGSLLSKMKGSTEPSTLDRVLDHTATFLRRKQVLKTLDFNVRGIAQTAVDSINSGTSVEYAAIKAKEVFAELVVRSGLTRGSADELRAIENFWHVLIKAIGQFDEHSSSSNGDIP